MVRSHERISRRGPVEREAADSPCGAPARAGRLWVRPSATPLVLSANTSYWVYVAGSSPNAVHSSGAAASMAASGINADGSLG